MKIDMSIVTYKDGKYEVIFKDVDTYREVTFTGDQKVSGEDFDFIQEIAPACVWTRYKRITSDD